VRSELVVCCATLRSSEDLARVRESGVFIVNDVESLWKFGSQYDVRKLMGDHREKTRYPIALPERKAAKVNARDLYILRPELVGAVAATDIDRIGLANKGEGGG